MSLFDSLFMVVLISAKTTDAIEMERIGYQQYSSFYFQQKTLDKKNSVGKTRHEDQLSLATGGAKTYPNFKFLTGALKTKGFCHVVIIV